MEEGIIQPLLHLLFKPLADYGGFYVVVVVVFLLGRGGGESSSTPR